MAMTERVVVLMSNEQKATVSRLAAAEQLSLSGFMRREALGYNVQLSALLNELTASTTQTAAALDRTLDRLDESERRRPTIEAAARARAITEFSVLDPELFAQITR